VQVVTEDALTNLSEFLPGLAKRKDIEIIRNGIDTEQYQKALINAMGQDVSKAREALGTTADRTLFGFFGRFMPEKGFPCLIDAVERLARDGEVSRKFKVLTVNSGCFEREYRSRVTEKGLDEYFIFQPKSFRVVELLSILDAVVMPSLWEAAGLLAM